MLLMAPALWACGGQVSETARITGLVENPTGEEVEVFYYKEFVTNSLESVTLSLDENNAFEGTLPMTEGQFVYLRVPGRTVQLYLLPGADVRVAFDAADPNALPEVSGEQSLESRFFLEYHQQLGSRYGRMMVLERVADLDAAAFVDFVRGVEQEKLAFLNDYEERAGLDPDFVQTLTTGFRYETYQFLLEYPRYHAYLTQGEGDPELPEGYYDFLEEAGPFLDDHVRARPYVSFLGAYLNHSMEEGVDPETDGRSYHQAQYDLAAGMFGGRSRDFLLSQTLISALNFSPMEEAEAMLEDYRQLVASADYRELVEEEYQGIMGTMPGNPAPDFTLTDINGQEVSLSDFRGKVVYLDFWASWCGPCMREVPHAKELKARMQGEEDLVFLYVSIDTDEAAWRRTVEEREIQGVHLNVPGGSHAVPASYNLKGVPTFYVIGRDGMIYDNRPPRPSNPKVDEVLLAALHGEDPA